MTPPFKNKFRRCCAFLCELFPACFSFMYSLCCDLTYTRPMFVDSSLPHHNIAVEGCLFHLRWRDCCVNYSIPFKQSFEWGGLRVCVCPSTANAMLICLSDIHKNAYFRRTSHIFLNLRVSPYMFYFIAKEREKGRSFNMWISFLMDISLPSDDRGFR